MTECSEFRVDGDYLYCGDRFICRDSGCTIDDCPKRTGCPDYDGSSKPIVKQEFTIDNLNAVVLKVNEFISASKDFHDKVNDCVRAHSYELDELQELNLIEVKPKQHTSYEYPTMKNKPEVAASAVTKLNQLRINAENDAAFYKQQVDIYEKGIKHILNENATITVSNKEIIEHIFSILAKIESIIKEDEVE